MSDFATLADAIEADHPAWEAAPVLILAVLNFDITNDEAVSANCLLIDSASRQVFPGYSAVSFLAQEEMVRADGGKLGPRAAKNLEKRRAEVAGEYPAATAGVVCNGPVRIAFLLNSPGGSGMVMRKLARACETVRQRGGSVSAFVSTQAQSAAGELLFEAPHDRRAVWERSRLMLQCPHTGDAAATVSSAVGRENIADHAERIRELLGREIRPERRNEILGRFEEILADNANTLNEIAFAGYEAAELGLVGTATPETDSLRKEFERTTGLRLPSGTHLGALSDFFWLSSLEVGCLERSGMHLLLRRDGDRVELEDVGHDTGPKETRVERLSTAMAWAKEVAPSHGL